MRAEAQATAGAGTPVPNPDSPLLHARDLVDDRELAEADKDEFAHRRIADQLVELALTVKPQSNIALYGPWGSGKSGIANLMRAKLKDSDKAKFARFDAFKYAETPLRRNFISAVATELGIKNRKYHDDLYAGRTRTEVQVPWEAVWKIVGVFLAILLVLVMGLVAVVALVAKLQGGDFSDNFRGLSKAAITAALVPAALLSALITFVNKTFQVDRSIAKPDSEEQFEKLLCDLVTDSKAERVIVFIDELDRCTSKDVVATLDGVRAFLGTDKCVFVVAADQQVLEQALSEREGQPTPQDLKNPYYSTGSAYLDKVFQYQLALPDLLPPNIAEFAARLVADRPDSLWASLRVQFVISVLIPGHVTSPRRVKHLLNAFALTYRLAEDRHRQGQLGADPASHAAAIAKLVCLRVEFPLFARDLTADADLPAYVLLAVAQRALPEGISEEAGRLARQYADQELPVATLLVSDSVTEVPGVPEDEDEVEADGPTMRARHHRQLLDYLNRTARVPGLTRDLIYMQSEESLTPIRTPVAKDLVAAAENDNVAEVVSIVRSRVPEEQQEEALLYLATRVRHTPGVTGDNIARCLLGIAALAPELPFDAIADQALNYVSDVEENGSILDADTVEGAWQMSLRLGYNAEGVQAEIIEAIAEDRNAPFAFLLKSPQAANVNSDGVVRAVGRNVVSSAFAQTLDALAALPADDRHAALALIEPVGDHVTAAFAAHDTWKKEKAASDEAAEEAAAAVAAGTASTTAAADEPAAPPAEPFNPSRLVSGLGTLARRWIDTGSPDDAYAVVRLLLSVGHQNARDQVEGLLPDLPRTSDPDVVARMLNGIQPRKLNLWPHWLDRIEPVLYADVDAAQWDNVGEMLVVRGSEASRTTAEVEAAASLLLTLIEANPGVRLDLTAHVISKTAGTISTDDQVMKQRATIEKFTPLVRLGFVDESRWNSSLLAGLASSLEEEIDATEFTDTFESYLRDFAAAAVGGTVKNSGLEDAESLIEAVRDATWLKEPLRTDLLMLMLETAHAQGADVVNDLPSTEQLVALIDSIGSDARVSLAKWMVLAHPDRETATTLLTAAAAWTRLGTPVIEGFRHATSSWSDEDRVAFVAHFAGKNAGPLPPKEVLTAISVDDAPESEMVELIVDRYSAATNNPARSEVLDLWTASRITTDANVTALYNRVAIPITKLKAPGGGTVANVEAVKTLLKALPEIGLPPKPTKKLFDTALGNAIDGNDALQKAALQALTPLGYSSKNTGFLRLGKKIDLGD